MNHFFPPVLLAIDIVQIVIFLLFIVGSIIGQLIKGMQDRNKKRPMKPLPRQGNAPQANPRANRPEIDREIADFLKQAKNRAQAREAGGGATQAVKAEVVKRERQQPRAKAKPDRPAVRTLAKREPVSAEVISPNESVGGHVQRHIVKGGLSQRDAHLGARVGESDERLEGHLSQIFDHQIGQLKHLDGPTGHVDQGTDSEAYERHTVESAQVAQIRAMLASPQQTGTAILLAEILRRPEDRW